MIVNTRADCCSARAGYRIVLPATGARTEPAELLLCGHHLRASRATLDAQGAVSFELDHVLAPV
jgi:hypothetical protein